jgi:GGDEF domain-containing protein
VLLLLSRLMRSSFRFSDHLYRVGGEEFVVLVSTATRSRRGRAFERLRHNHARQHLPRQVGSHHGERRLCRAKPGDSPINGDRARRPCRYYAKRSRAQPGAKSHAELLARRRSRGRAEDRDVELF